MKGIVLEGSGQDRKRWIFRLSTRSVLLSLKAVFWILSIHRALQLHLAYISALDAVSSLVYSHQHRVQLLQVTYRLFIHIHFGCYISKPTKNFLELVPACTSLYQLVQAWKVGKVARVKARSKNSQVISENSCWSEGRVIKLILSHSICTKRHK